MDARSENIVDVNLDDLTEEELEAYLVQLDQASNKTHSRMKELEDKKEGWQKKIDEADLRIEARNEEIAVIDARMKARDEEYDRIIEEALPFTGKVSQFDLSKLQSDDGRFMEIIRRGFEQKNSPPSSERGSSPRAASSSTSTPPSKGSIGDDVSGDLSDLSLSSSRKSSSSDEEKEKTKDSPESPKSKLFSSAMVGSLLPPAAITQPRPSFKSKADLKEQSVGQRSQVSQIPSVVVSKTSAPPEKEKSLLAKLGFNRNKSVLQPQVPPVGNGTGVTHVVLQRNGLNGSTVR